MRGTVLGLTLALALSVTACDADEPSSSEAPTRSPATTTAADPHSDVEARMRALAEDALAIDPRAVVVAGPGPEHFLETLFYDDIRDYGRGTIFMPASLTVRFPLLDPRKHGRKLLRMFKRNGFGTGLTYDVGDLSHGQVQKSHDLRCRLEGDAGTTWLKCIPWDFYYFMETEVVGELLSLYSDETDDPDTGCWEVTYPHEWGVEPPVAALLRTGTCAGPDEFRAYLGQNGRWKRVAKAPSYAALGAKIRGILCVPERRPAFRNLCPLDSA